MLLLQPPDENLARRLPLPLAQLYRRAHNAKTALERHLTAFYLWEAAIKLLGMAAVARYAAVPGRDPAVTDTVLGTLKQPTLGGWQELTMLLVPRLANGGEPGYRAVRGFLFARDPGDLTHTAHLSGLLTELLEDRRAARVTVQLPALIEQLVKFRNQEIGHTARAVREEEFYERWGPALLAAAAEVLDRLDVLAGWRLTQTRLARHTEQADEVAIWHALVGDQPVPLPVEAVGAHPGCTYLLGPAGEFVPFHPLALFEEPKADFSFYSRRTPELGYEFLNYTTGEVRQKAPRWSFDELLSGAVPAYTRPDRPEHDLGPITAPYEPTLAQLGPLSSPPIPRRLGEFELLSELGRGGMGIVYRAWQPSLGREVALKRLGHIGNTKAEARFRREIKALGRVDHPNLIRIFTSGADPGGDLFYAMELVEGATLSAVSAAVRDGPQGGAVDLPGWSRSVVAAWEAARRAERWLEGQSPADPPAPPAIPSGPRPGEPPRLGRDAIRRVVELVAQAADAAHALHEVGILHQDIKPGNVMVGREGTRATLMDLGVARIEDEPRTQTLSARTGPGFVGTLRFASPERVQGGPGAADRRGDVYSLGATLWEALTLQPLYGDTGRGDQLKLIQQILEGDVGRPVKFNPAIDRDLEAIILHCLEKDPARRYGTARALADDLRRWLSGMPIAARPITALGRARRWLRRHGRRVGEVALLLLLGAALQSALTSAPFGTELGTLTAGRVGERVLRYGGWLLAAILAVTTFWQWRVRSTGILVRPLVAGDSPPATDDPTIDPAPAPAPPRMDPPTEAEPEPPPAAPPPPPPETARPAATRRARAAADEAFSSQTVVLRYPAPVAIAYRRFCSRTEPRDRLAQLFDTFEITVKYLVYLAVSDLARARVLGGRPCPPLPRHSGFNFTREPARMTLGRWLESLRAAADELGRADDRFFAELPGVCGTGGVLDRDIFRWIGDNRNAATHRRGGLALHSEKCVPLLREARPRLERMFQEIGFVRRYPLGFVTAGFPGSGDAVRYRVHSCMGARVAHGEEVYPMEATARFPVGVPFVVGPDETAALCLWPFLLHRESDATQRSSLYVFEGVEEGSGWLARVVASAIDHEDDWVSAAGPPGAADHDWLWDALAKLPQVVPITPELRLAEGLAESLVGRLTGEALGDRRQYKLIGPIARGGFGTVYDAVDVRSGARVALKVLEEREGLGPRDDVTQFKRFQQEYEKLRKAGSEFPGIVRTFEWGISIVGRREYPWYSMEFAAGGDLAARLAERQAGLRGRTPWEVPGRRAEVVAEFRAVAAAVAHLHDLNIVHRDVKPGNVLVMDGGELRLSDFGLVKDLERPRPGVSAGPGSTRGAVVGTRDYMAPEQERGGVVTPAADVYALGVLLAELATGRRPPPAAGVVAGSTVETDPLVDRLPDPVRRVVVRCTQVEPNDRYADASQVLHEFDRAVKQIPG